MRLNTTNNRRLKRTNYVTHKAYPPTPHEQLHHVINQNATPDNLIDMLNNNTYDYDYNYLTFIENNLLSHDQSANNLILNTVNSPTLTTNGVITLIKSTVQYCNLQTLKQLNERLKFNQFNAVSNNIIIWLCQDYTYGILNNPQLKPHQTAPLIYNFIVKLLTTTLPNSTPNTVKNINLCGDLTDDDKIWLALLTIQKLHQIADPHNFFSIEPFIKLFLNNPIKILPCKSTLLDNYDDILKTATTSELDSILNQVNYTTRFNYDDVVKLITKTPALDYKFTVDNFIRNVIFVNNNLTTTERDSIAVLLTLN